MEHSNANFRHATKNWVLITEYQVLVTQVGDCSSLTRVVCMMDAPSEGEDTAHRHQPIHHPAAHPDPLCEQRQSWQDCSINLMQSANNRDGGQVIRNQGWEAGGKYGLKWDPSINNQHLQLQMYHGESVFQFISLWQPTKLRSLDYSIIELLQIKNEE